MLIDQNYGTESRVYSGFQLYVRMRTVMDERTKQRDEKIYFRKLMFHGVSFSPLLHINENQSFEELFYVDWKGLIIR